MLRMVPLSHEGEEEGAPTLVLPKGHTYIGQVGLRLIKAAGRIPPYRGQS